MADKFLNLDANGNIAEKNPISTSSGSSNANQIVMTNGAGFIDPTLLPGNTAITVTASEAISAGAFINGWNNAGSFNVRNADNSGMAKAAHGFVLSAISANGTGTAYFWEGENTALTGLTVGSQDYMLGIAGAATLTVPTTTGAIVQKLGVVRSATEMSVSIDRRPIARA